MEGTMRKGNAKPEEAKLDDAFVPAETFGVAASQLADAQDRIQELEEQLADSQRDRAYLAKAVAAMEPGVKPHAQRMSGELTAALAIMKAGYLTRDKRANDALLDSLTAVLVGARDYAENLLRELNVEMEFDVEEVTK
jgi:hypothetical protein